MLVTFSFQDSLPLQDFFMAIDEHYNLRNRIAERKADLNQKANEFRIIEKRMLTRFKVVYNSHHFLTLK